MSNTTIEQAMELEQQTFKVREAMRVIIKACIQDDKNVNCRMLEAMQYELDCTHKQAKEITLVTLDSLKR